MFCPHCGTHCPDIAHFCSKCGRCLDEAQRMANDGSTTADEIEVTLEGDAHQEPSAPPVAVSAAPSPPPPPHSESPAPPAPSPPTRRPLCRPSQPPPASVPSTHQPSAPRRRPQRLHPPAAAVSPRDGGNARPPAVTPPPPPATFPPPGAPLAARRSRSRGYGWVVWPVGLVISVVSRNLLGPGGMLALALVFCVIGLIIWSVSRRR